MSHIKLNYLLFSHIEKTADVAAIMGSSAGSVQFMRVPQQDLSFYSTLTTCPGLIGEEFQIAFQNVVSKFFRHFHEAAIGQAKAWCLTNHRHRRQHTRAEQRWRGDQVGQRTASCEGSSAKGMRRSMGCQSYSRFEWSDFPNGYRLFVELGRNRKDERCGQVDSADRG